MRLVHLSDPHVIDWYGARVKMFLNKRVTGAANFSLFRRKVHKRHILEALIEDVARAEPEHVVVTGDISSLAFELEMKVFGELLERFGLDSHNVSIIPGNHDAYTRRAFLKRRTLVELGRFATSDLNHGMPGFPFVRLRGPVAIIGLNSAVARPWFIASGLLGRPQLEVLRALLKTPEVKTRYPVILVHHPPLAYERWLKDVHSGLMDRELLLDVLRDGLAGRDALILSGHWHHRYRIRLDLPGRVELLVAPSASHVGGSSYRVAAYHMIHFTENADGVAKIDGIEVRAYDESQRQMATLATD